MKELWRIVVVLVLGLWFSLQSGYSCDQDSHCEAHQVCCNKRCKSWPKCFLNTEKECFYDTHCVKGAVCIDNKCQPKSTPTAKCTKDQDCIYQKHSTSYSSVYNTSRCCDGECFKIKSCLLIKVNSTSTTLHKRSKPSCLTNYNCPTEFECIEGECVLQNEQVQTTSKLKEEPKEPSLSRAGFLSAAILTSAVFLTVMCFCFLKETKYVRRHIERTQDRSTLTERNCTTQEVYHEPRSNSAPSWVIFPRLYVYNERENGNDSDDTASINPPSYRSVCFEHELPPSYDEAVNNQNISSHNTC